MADILYEFDPMDDQSTLRVPGERNWTFGEEGEKRFKKVVVDGRDEMRAAFRPVIETPEKTCADVAFEVGGEVFGGLRGVLRLRCQVIESMLGGSFREASAVGPIRLPHFNAFPEVFKEFLYFCHTGYTTLEDMVTAMHLYEIAKFFCMDSLATSCADLLQATTVKPPHAVKCFSSALEHGIQGMLVEAWRTIGRDANVALANAKEVAELLPQRYLRYLFESSDSSVSEVVLVQILAELSGDRRAELTPFVRLPLVSAKAMMQTIAPSKFFATESCLAAMAFQNDPSSVLLPAALTRPRSFAWTSPPKRPLRCEPRAARRSVLSAAHAESSSWGRGRSASEGWQAAISDLQAPPSEAKPEAMTASLSDTGVVLGGVPAGALRLEQERPSGRMRAMSAA